MASNLDVMEIVRREVDLSSVNTVLDLGCGSFYKHPLKYEEHDLLYNLFRDKDITGVDMFEPNIAWRNEHGPQGTYLLADMVTFDYSRKFDLILCHHSLEHLSIFDCNKVLEGIEQGFVKYAIIGGPIGYHDNSAHMSATGNPHEVHRIGLHPFFFEKLGYMVFPIYPAFVAIKKRD